jgi:hypothetical protein
MRATFDESAGSGAASPSASAMLPAPPRPQADRGIAYVLAILVALAVGAGLGLGATWLAVDRGVGFGTVTAGSWVSWPRIGALDADPYSRAVVAHAGAVPLGLGEGLAFLAATDDAGRPLERGCSYRLTGRTPPARLWTLTLHDPDGGLLPNPSDRTGFTSAEVLRNRNADFTIALGPDPQPGNWVPVTGQGPFVLALRLYETPVSASSKSTDANLLPRIERLGCP